jgi:hypothetical protein
LRRLPAAAAGPGDRADEDDLARAAVFSRSAMTLMGVVFAAVLLVVAQRARRLLDLVR